LKFNLTFKMVIERYKEKELLKLIAIGDEKSFNELFALYRNQLYDYLLKVTKSQIISEEVTLDIFIKIWNGRDFLYKIDNLDAFLFRVAHNKAIDYLRMAKRSRLQQMEIWTDLQNLASQDSSDERIIKLETELELQKSINKLSPKRQEVFRLSREENLTYDQIAEKMKISRNTVRNHISAALNFIRGNISIGTYIASIVIIAII